MRRGIRTTLIAAFAAAVIIAVPLTARALEGDGNDDIADAARASVPLPPTITGTLTSDPTDNGVRDPGTDPDDVYRIYLKKDQWFYASMTGGDTDFDLLLFDESATSVSGTVPGVAYSEKRNTSDERFFYQAPASGNYYLDVYAFGGTGAYTVTFGYPSANRPWLTATTPYLTVPYAAPTAITGVLRNSAETLAGRTIALFGKTTGVAESYKQIATAVTAADGSYVLTVKPTRAMNYDVRYLGDEKYLPAANVRDVKIVPTVYLTTPSVPKTVKKNKTFTASGYLKPKHTAGAAKSVKIRCYRLSGGKYRLVKSVWARNYTYKKSGQTYTKYSARVTLPKKGTWKLVAYAPADKLHLATTSAARIKTVK